MSQVEILSYLKTEVALCGQGQIEYLRKQPTVQQRHIPKAGLGLDLGMTAPI